MIQAFDPVRSIVEPRACRDSKDNNKLGHIQIPVFRY